MAKVSIYEFNQVEKMLKSKLDISITSSEMLIVCDNKCRLLSHLLHKAKLDIHCNKDGYFIISLEEYSIENIIGGFNKIICNPQWIIEFVEKYMDNQFMMESTFKDASTSEA